MLARKNNCCLIIQSFDFNRKMDFLDFLMVFFFEILQMVHRLFPLLSMYFMFLTSGSLYFTFLNFYSFLIMLCLLCDLTLQVYVLSFYASFLCYTSILVVFYLFFVFKLHYGIVFQTECIYIVLSMFLRKPFVNFLTVLIFIK